MPIKLSESQIKKQIIEYLWLRKVFAWTQYNGGIYDPKFGGFRKLTGGNRKGISDVLGIFAGRFLAIEVKVPGGKPSKEQVGFGRDVIRNGGIWFVATSIADVERNLYG